MKVFPIADPKPYGMNDDAYLVTLTKQEAVKLAEAVHIVSVMHDRIKSWQTLNQDMKKLEGQT